MTTLPLSFLVGLRPITLDEIIRLLEIIRCGRLNTLLLWYLCNFHFSLNAISIDV